MKTRRAGSVCVLLVLFLAKTSHSFDSDEKAVAVKLKRELKKQTLFGSEVFLEGD